ncbi:MAG TPA: Clp protease N-terminal domain-containing protein [Streptosporangiaceae bacterium]|nr:Clp protease N-terminal domain-containing protein [Streptosporangiaceae bacterium]
MMFERFDDDARTVVVRAVEHAIRLGHRYVGGEHILLAVVSTGQPASAVMRAQGVTPELVEEEIVRRIGLGAGVGLFAGLDRDALATIGIDLDAVRARIEASFGPQALTRAAQTAHQGGRGHPGLRPPRIVRAWRRKRRARRAMAHAPGSRPPAAGRYRAPGPAPSGHIPFTPATKKILELALREAGARDDTQIGVEHIALALTTVASGLVPPILAAAGTQAPALRTAILDRYRQAS